MRQYRGKTKDGKWVYGYLDWERVEYGDDKEYAIHTGHDGGFEEYYVVNIESVGQDTGLKDIYEGDKFRGAKSGTIYWVVFRDGEYILVYDSDSPPMKARQHCTLRYAIHNLDIDKIGTIHDDSPQKIASPEQGSD